MRKKERIIMGSIWPRLIVIGFYRFSPTLKSPADPKFVF